jgi:hypothetical protein
LLLVSSKSFTPDVAVLRQRAFLYPFIPVTVTVDYLSCMRVWLIRR